MSNDKDGWISVKLFRVDECQTVRGDGTSESEEGVAEEQLPQPDVEGIELVKVLHALGDPVRLWLLCVYADGEEHSCAPEAVSCEHLHKSTVSHHMRVMREAGITSTRVAGRNRYVRLRRDDLDARFPGLLDALIRSMPWSGDPSQAGPFSSTAAGAAPHGPP
jgi:DNA-binding transcriptional ArsR family regulator